MTRGLHPPETLSAEEVHTLHSIRKNMFSQGLVGGGLGACTGFVLYTGAQWAKRYGYLRGSSLNRNVGMLVTLTGFAFGTYLGATVTGKEEIHNLHPIFHAGAMTTTTTTDDVSLVPSSEGETDAGQQQQRKKLSYQARWFRARKEVEAGEGGPASGDEPPSKQLDRQRLQHMRMTRRKTLMDNLHQGHGLTDSHSGRWVDENSETKFDKE